jgi:ABC-type transporter Mla MlaB component
MHRTPIRTDGAGCDDFFRRHRSFNRTAVYEQTTITFRIRGPLARSDLPGLCDRVCGLLEETHPTVALCDVSGIAADAVAVDALARLQLAAHRHGCQVRLRGCTRGLRDLVAFMGLADVLVE